MTSEILCERIFKNTKKIPGRIKTGKKQRIIIQPQARVPGVIKEIKPGFIRNSGSFFEFYICLIYIYLDLIGIMNINPVFIFSTCV